MADGCTDARNVLCAVLDDVASACSYGADAIDRLNAEYAMAKHGLTGEDVRQHDDFDALERAACHGNVSAVRWLHHLVGGLTAEEARFVYVRADDHPELARWVREEFGPRVALRKRGARR